MAHNTVLNTTQQIQCIFSLLLLVVVAILYTHYSRHKVTQQFITQLTHILFLKTRLKIRHTIANTTPKTDKAV